MASDETVRMIIELESGAEPIRGTLESASGEVCKFNGWMQLSIALTHACGPGPVPASEVNETPQDPLRAHPPAVVAGDRGIRNRRPWLSGRLR